MGMGLRATRGPSTPVGKTGGGATTLPGSPEPGNRGCSIGSLDVNRVFRRYRGDCLFEIAE